MGDRRDVGVSEGKEFWSSFVIKLSREVRQWGKEESGCQRKFVLFN